MKQSIIFQRAEGLALLIASLYLYHHLQFNFLYYIILLFSIDVFMVGYLFDNKIGAYVYNLGHSLIIPCLLLVAGVLIQNNAAIGFSLIWFGHIGLDRTLGYGLKFTSGFKHTHLGDIGKNSSRP